MGFRIRGTGLTSDGRTGLRIRAEVAPCRRFPVMRSPLPSAFGAWILSTAFALPLAALEPDFQSLRILPGTPPQYPDCAETANLPSGEARVVITVDAEGRLEDWLLTRYTHRVFADAAVAAVREWKFEPARRKNEAVGVRREVVFQFEASKSVVSFVELDLISTRFERQFGPTQTRCVVDARELDRPLTLTAAPRPALPRTETARGPGTVLVDFYVDDEGRTRMPVVVRSSDPLLASHAVEAVTRWRFAPPTLRGQPTAVRVRQEFRFAAGSATTSPGPENATNSRSSLPSERARHSE